jgi:hemerythrin-like domain-containing protein
MNEAIRIIRDEHRSISAVLSALKQLARLAQDPKVKPEFAAFRAMIYYIDAFPERMHHPKEDSHLFARLVERAPEARPLIEELQAEHVAGAHMIRELERALLEFEETWPRGAARFAAAVDAYLDFHWRHMKKEEERVLPLAERALAPEDWQAIEAAFMGHDDPIADLREKDFRALYQRIVALAPEPIGVGAPWKRQGG